MALPDNSTAAMPGGPTQGPYHFPLERDDGFQSKIVFQAIKVTPPKIAVFGSSETVEEGEATSKVGGDVNVTGRPVVNEISGQRATLYMPVSFAVNDGLEYQNAALGQIGGGLLNAGNNASSLAGAGMKALTDGLGSIFDMAKSGAVSRVAAMRASQNFGGEIGSAVSVLTRASMNPNIRTQFQSVSVREFSFQFKLIPRSPEEASSMLSIIRFFRFHAYPEELNFAGANVAYNYPNMFRIQLLSGKRKYKNIGTPIKLSYLKGIQATYNPTSTAIHEDGAPTEVDLSLTFTEYKPLSRKDIFGEQFKSFYNYENQGSFPKDNSYGAL